MTHDPKAPLPDDVEKSLSNVACGVTDYSDCTVLRAHVSSLYETIAALEHKHDDLVTRCVQAESDRDALKEKLAEQIREDEMRLINHCIKIIDNNSRSHLHAEAEFLTKIAELEAENKRMREAIDNHRNCYSNCPVCGHSESCSDDDVCLAVSPIAQTG